MKIFVDQRYLIREDVQSWLDNELNMPANIRDAIRSGDYKLVDHPTRWGIFPDGISVNDAHFCGFIDLTADGAANLEAEIAAFEQFYE